MSEVLDISDIDDCDHPEIIPLKSDPDLGVCTKCGDDTFVIRESCDHEFVVLKAIALSGTPKEHLGSIVPYEWCRLCGAIHHDFLGQKRPGDPFP